MDHFVSLEEVVKYILLALKHLWMIDIYIITVIFVHYSKYPLIQFLDSFIQPLLDWLILPMDVIKNTIIMGIYYLLYYYLSYL